MKLCAGSGGHLSAVEGIKYPGGFIVGISRGGGGGGDGTLQRVACVLALSEKGETGVHG